VDLVQAEVESAAVGDLKRRVAEIGPFGEERAHLPRGLEVALRVGAGDVVELSGTSSRMHSSASARKASSGTR
jgi:hypothetical protein